MSFDIWIQFFDHGEGASVPRALVEQIFGKHAIDPQFPLREVTYADGQTMIYGAEDDPVLRGQSRGAE